MKPTIFFAFADHLTDSLPSLIEEKSEVSDLLLPLDARDFINLVVNESTSVESLVSILTEYQDQLAIFHFSGHANGELLEMSNIPAFANGLAGLLGMAKQLKLVFLNGCASRGHVDDLLNAGVQAVIATAVPIGDRMATDFSVAFYRALVNKRTLLEAFHFATEVLELRNRRTPNIEIRTRGSLLTDDEALPWGLYMHPESTEEALHWRLPFYRETGLSEIVKVDIQQRVSTNKYIVQILDSLCQVDKDLHANYLTRYYQGKIQAADPSSYMDVIIQSFPWVIGAQLGLLRQKATLNQERLTQLISTYIITSQFLYYILLSDCWEQKLLHKWTVAPGADIVSIPGGREELLQTDFCQKLLLVYHLMSQQQNTVYALPEIADLCRRLADEQNELAKAYRYLETVRRQNTPIEVLERTVQRMEAALAILLKNTTFLAGYHFLTIRNIYLDNFRTQPLEYELDMGRLHALASSSLGMYENNTYRRKRHYAHSRSIVLTSNERDLQFSLSLSPFVIDINTFVGRPLPYIYMLAYSEQDYYVYYSVNHDIFTALKGGNGFDLIHTGMSKEDFLLGTNDTSEELDFLDDFNMLSSPSVADKKVDRVFAPLEDQLARLQSSFLNHHVAELPV